VAGINRLKIIRVLHLGTPRWAILKDPENYNLMFGDLFRLPPDIDARPHHLDVSKMLPPTQPTKIVAVGLNYRDHTKEMGQADPEVPVLFLKPPSSLLRPGGTILLPPASERVDHEAELAVVLKSRLRNAGEADAAKAIWGFTCLNDVTARDLQHKDGQWTRAKGFDTFCPIGPWIDTDFKESAQAIVCRVNGEERQSARLDQRIWNCAQLLAFASSVMTLEPMDVLTTGTPSGIGPLKTGDEVEVEIEGLGCLRNKVGVS
jgi:2-keto-4-pentenoate hydratase/2-oxohepta-3-ene-1,7-dioic acid hydratase in catechol pathway